MRAMVSSVRMSLRSDSVRRQEPSLKLAPLRRVSCASRMEKSSSYAPFVDFLDDWRLFAPPGKLPFQ